MGLSNLRTGRRRCSYRWWGHLVLRNVGQAHSLVREWASRFRRVRRSQQFSGLPFWADYRTSLSQPLLVWRVVIVVGNFYHSYRMPPLYCLGASGFLSFGRPFLCRLSGTSAGRVAGLLVVLSSHGWGTCSAFPRGVVLILAANTCGDARPDLCQMNGLTSLVADLPALVGGLRPHRVLRFVRGSQSPFSRQKFMLLGVWTPRLVAGRECLRHSRRFAGRFQLRCPRDPLCTRGGFGASAYSLWTHSVAGALWRYLANEQGRLVRVGTRRLLRPIQSGIQHCGLKLRLKRRPWLVHHR